MHDPFAALLVAGCAALLLSACATAEPTTPEAKYTAPVMRTGSNIPVARDEGGTARPPSPAEQQKIDGIVLPRPTRNGSGGG